MNKWIGLFFCSFCSLGAFALVQTETHTSFRTPAKRLASAYTIKMTLKRDVYEYTVPMWVRPDQAQSTLDQSMLKELGWIYPDLRADEILLSNEVMSPPRFKNAKSDWVSPPDFPKTCCYGVLGRDFLQNYEIKFDPQEPSHLEWRAQVGRSDAPKASAHFLKSLAELFNLRSETVTHEGHKLDLSETPYVVNLTESTLKIESPRDIPTRKTLKIRESPIFYFSFTIQDRDVEIGAFASDVAKSAAAMGVRKGVRVLEFNWIPISLWDKYEIRSLLQGKKMNLLPMKLEYRARTMTQEAIRKEVNFDFIKNEFVPK